MQTMCNIAPRGHRFRLSQISVGFPVFRIVSLLSSSDAVLFTVQRLRAAAETTLCSDHERRPDVVSKEKQQRVWCGVSFKSDGSKDYKIYLKEEWSFVGPEQQQRPDNPVLSGIMGDCSEEDSEISCDSDVSIRSDRSNGHITDFSQGVIPNYTAPTESSSVSIKSDGPQDCTEDFKETSPSPNKKMVKRRTESFDSGVSLMSGQSNERLFDFKDSVLPSRSDLSSFDKTHVVADDENLVKSSDDLGRDDPGALV